MSISPALQTALQSLLVQQNGLNVTGHNIANANTPGYSRQRANLVPAMPTYYLFGAIGNGVEVKGIERVVDEFLNSQIRNADSGANGQQVLQTAYDRSEAIFNELTDNDLSTALDKFFGALQDLSVNVESQPTRDLAVQQAQALSQMVTGLYASLQTYHQQLDSDLDTMVGKVNGLLDEIRGLNVQIATHEGGSGVSANDLRDTRDQKLRELSGLMNITVIEQPNGGANVSTKGMPLVIYDTVFHLTTRLDTSAGLSAHQVVFEADGSPLLATSGKLPATIQARDQLVKGFMDDLNQFAADLIFQFNRVHSQGVGSRQLTSVTGENAAMDPTAALNLVNLGFTPAPGTFEIKNGSLTIDLVNSVSGEVHKYSVAVDLDGVGADTSLNGLAAAINAAVPANTIRAAVDTTGHLRIDSLDPQTYSFFFSEDSSGVLAALGINGFFSGHDAATMGVSPALVADSRYLAGAQSAAPGDNQNLLELIGLRDAAAANGGAMTFEDYYRGIIGRMAAESERSTSRLQAQNDLVTQMENERETVSGVSLDEELTRMIQFQRAYQASARFVSVSDSVLDTLINKT